MVGSLTVLPALLGKLGDRVDRGLLAVLAAGILRLLRPFRRRPRFLVGLVQRRTLQQRAKGSRGESRIWGLVLGPALRFPALAALGSVALLVVLALPTLGMRTKLSGFSDLPKDLAIVKTYDRIQAAFPGAQTPAQVVIQAPDVTAPPVRGGDRPAAPRRPGQRRDAKTRSRRSSTRRTPSPGWRPARRRRRGRAIGASAGRAARHG